MKKENEFLREQKYYVPDKYLELMSKYEILQKKLKDRDDLFKSERTSSIMSNTDGRFSIMSNTERRSSIISNTESENF